MSKMPGNLDYNSAVSMLHRHKPDKFANTDTARLADAMNANTMATLALTHEQRTANLIAKMALTLQMLQAAGATLSETSEEWDALDDDILARLGLEEA